MIINYPSFSRYCELNDTSLILIDLIVVWCSWLFENVQHIITTFAGTGIHGDSGDGGKATTALLSGPQGVSEDMHENGYVADAYNIKNRLVSQPQLLASTQV